MAEIKNHLWIRAEVKPFEERTPITPDVCKSLMKDGFQITVEKSPTRCVKDEDYEAAGCTIVESGTWVSAPKSAYIFGLKELPENEPENLEHTHIYFAHCFKGQDGWKDTLKRFHRGKGSLLDLEFLADDRGVRVAAFGYMAGYSGAALGLLLWTHKLNCPAVPFSDIKPYENASLLVNKVKSCLNKSPDNYPKVLVIGALGRCGRGAVDFARQSGLPEDHIIQWDLEETRKGGPFFELLDVDIVVNCIYLTQKTPEFLTLDMLNSKVDRRLSVFVDVSCDYNNPNNPIPIYRQMTTFDKPALSIPTIHEPAVDVIAIDHLPTLLPLESSERFGADLLPSLLQLKNIDQSQTWIKADKLFREKMQEALAE